MNEKAGKRLSVTFPTDVHEEIQRLAREHERSFAAEVIWALRQYIRRLWSLPDAGEIDERLADAFTKLKKDEAMVEELKRNVEALQKQAGNTDSTLEHSRASNAERRLSYHLKDLAGMLTASADNDLESLGLTKLTVFTLLRAGINDVETLRTKTDDELLAIRNLGQRRLKEIRERLSHGKD